MLPALCWRTVQDYNPLRSFLFLFFSFMDLTRSCFFWFFLYGFFVLGMRTLCKGGSDDTLAGPLGRCVGTSDCATVRLFVVVAFWGHFVQ